MCDGTRNIYMRGGGIHVWWVEGFMCERRRNEYIGILI